MTWLRDQTYGPYDEIRNVKIQTKTPALLEFIRLRGSRSFIGGAQIQTLPQIPRSYQIDVAHFAGVICDA
jgi:hypothetical protein